MKRITSEDGLRRQWLKWVLTKNEVFVQRKGARYFFRNKEKRVETEYALVSAGYLLIKKIKKEGFHGNAQNKNNTI